MDAGHRGNNLDGLRLLFALAVICSHAYPLVTGRGETEPLLVRSHHHTDLGRLAVAFFFVVSGFLITRSYLFSRSAGSYLAKRALRIFPAYVVAVALCVAVVAPAVAWPGLGREDLWRLLAQALFMEPLDCRSTFGGNPFPHALNASVWTIRYEFGCYLLVIALGGAGLLRRPWAVLALLLAVAASAAAPRAVPWLRPRYPLLGQWSAWCRFVREFLVGVSLYLWRGRLPVGRRCAAAALLAAVASVYLRPAELAALVLDVSAGYAVYCLLFARWLPLRGFGRYGDFSYGLYLYGWPVEKLLVWRFGPRLSPAGLFVAASVLALGLAAVSWHAVERPCLRLKRRLTGTAASVDALVPCGAA